VFAGRHVRVIVQNPDDRTHLLAHHILPEARLRLIRGSGVDVEHWTPGQEAEGTPSDVLASRLIWAKGLAELAEASRQLRRDGVAVRVLIAGDPDPESRDRVPAETLRAWEAVGLIEWFGFRNDLREVVQRAAFAVLPSYYKEGVPKSLLEAMAAGKPILTTDMPGCREVVVPGHNGLLVPPRDVPSLTAAMKTLLADKALRHRMGARSREMVVANFSDDSVNSRILDVYRELLGERWRPGPRAAAGQTV
jgi:glycosyltransferase involved in cell wall biosynthesis